MRSILYVGESAFTELREEWDTLATRAMTDTPFQTQAYQRAWWEHLKPSGSTLVTIATRSDKGELVGIACLFALDQILHFNGCIEETDYLDLIAPPNLAATVWQETLDCLEVMDAIPWRALDLCNIPEQSLSRTILPTLAEKKSYHFEENVIEVCPIIQLPDAFDAYLESLDSKQRRELSRKLRRAEAAEVTTSIINQSDNIETEVESFLELLQKSTFEKRDWLNDGRRAMFHDVARAMQDRGALQLMFTAVEGRRAAALFNFDYNDRIWVYNSGLDPTAFAALSPGVILTATAIEEAIKLGRSEFDFLRGDEEYKYRFGAVDTKIYRCRVERPA
jgi:CelD/BcsL family acetyltransferase involved in cellulose biosynthesis